jgi:WTAP/Mum2p family
LRRYLPNTLNPGPEDDNTDVGASNPKLLAVLMPHVLPVSVMGPDGTSGSGAASVPHPGVMNALLQRAKLLQEENDELYSVLRRNETGKLDEEVKALRRIVGKLERSLRGQLL